MASGRAFAFKPSKLTDFTERLWEKSKSELTKEAKADDEPEESANKKRRVEPDDPAKDSVAAVDKAKGIFGHGRSVNGAGGNSSSFVFGAKIADRVAAVCADASGGDANASSAEAVSSTTDVAAPTKEHNGSSGTVAASNAGDSRESVVSDGAAVRAEDVVGFASLAQKAGTSNGFGEAEKQPTPSFSEGLSTASSKKTGDGSAPAVVPAVKVVTGEEDEVNLFQATCKLHVLDQKDNSWHERGIGTLRVNQNDNRKATHTIPESRIVVRVQGGLRLALNSQLWPAMVVQRVANQPKRLRVSAVDFQPPHAVHFYLITMKAESDVDELYRLLTEHISQLKQRPPPVAAASDAPSTDDTRDAVGATKTQAAATPADDDGNSTAATTTKPTAATSVGDATDDGDTCGRQDQTGVVEEKKSEEQATATTVVDKTANTLQQTAIESQQQDANESTTTQDV